MRNWSLRLLLPASALALVATGVLVAGVSSYLEIRNLAREEAVARAARAAQRGVGALRSGLQPAFLEQRTGIELTLRRRPEIDAAFGDPRIPFWRQALAEGAALGYLDGGWGAVAVIAIPESDPAGVLEARVPATIALAPARLLVNRTLWVGSALAALAALAAALLTRWLTEPIAALAAVAERLGEGELERPLPTVAGREIAVLAASLDRMRSGFRDASAELETSRAQLAAVVDGIAEGVFAVDRDRRIRFASERGAERLGLPAAELLGRFCGDLLRPAPLAGQRPCDTACPILEARYRGTSRALERLGDDGHPWLVVSSPPRAGLQVLVVREESPLEAARRARDAVVADLAHELQTPLAAQRAAIELLQDRLAESDPVALELVQPLASGGLRLGTLIENLLESVRIESGQQKIRRVEVDLEELIEEAIALSQPLTGRRGQSVELELDPPLPALQGDPQRLGQVLVNLLANASKFGPEGSTIRIGVQPVERGIELTVEDQGPGFPKQHGAWLTARFARGEREPAEPGSGLGLFICRSILERHGGGLRVERRQGRTRVIARLATAPAPEAS